jgi:RNA polymerase sigma-70 factor (ECF subfamily)
MRLFEPWYANQRPKLVGAMTAVFCDPGLAADVADEAFARAYERWDRVGCMGSPEGWVYQTALNAGRRSLRLRRRERAAVRILPESCPRGPTPETMLELVDLLRRLPRRQRQVLALRYIADLTHAQVAEVLGVAEGTVAATLHQARGALSKQLTRSDISPQERRAIEQ